MLHHVELNVGDLATSGAFYDALLGRLGYRVFEEGETWRSYVDGSCYLVLAQADDRFVSRGFHRKAVGINHLAFAAPDRGAVDGLQGWLVEHDVPVLYAGAIDAGSSDEGPNYAVYFEDPDRLKLEYVFRPLDGAPSVRSARSEPT
jgi:catechol 2,3-dioxygenase-like lactoylglutathione lyase family enzyme